MMKSLELAAKLLLGALAPWMCAVKMSCAARSWLFKHLNLSQLITVASGEGVLAQAAQGADVGHKCPLSAEDVPEKQLGISKVHLSCSHKGCVKCLPREGYHPPESFKWEK